MHQHEKLYFNETWVRKHSERHRRPYLARIFWTEIATRAELLSRKVRNHFRSFHVTPIRLYFFHRCLRCYGPHAILLLSPNVDHHNLNATPPSLLNMFFSHTLHCMRNIESTLVWISKWNVHAWQFNRRVFKPLTQWNSKSQSHDLMYSKQQRQSNKRSQHGAEWRSETENFSHCDRRPAIG